MIDGNEFDKVYLENKSVTEGHTRFDLNTVTDVTDHSCILFSEIADAAHPADTTHEYFLARR